MGRIISRLYEDSLQFMQYDLNDYLYALIYLKYFNNHKVYYSAHADRLRSKFIVRRRVFNNNEIGKNFIHSTVLSNDNIVNTYNKYFSKYVGSRSSEENREADIKNITENDILNDDWFYDYVMECITNCDEKTTEYIKDLILGGYYREYE